MTDDTHEVRIRSASADDIPAIARIHADSWRRHYRGMYSDHYLDGDLDSDRLAAWTAKVGRDEEAYFTVVAERGATVVGFAHVALDGDPKWGALVDNLHVSRSVQGGGIGSRLLDHVARLVRGKRPGRGIYLWVLELNTAATGFYLARRGTLADRELSAPPSGDARNLHGSPMRVRVTWADPALLIRE